MRHPVNNLQLYTSSMNIVENLFTLRSTCTKAKKKTFVGLYGFCCVLWNEIFCSKKKRNCLKLMAVNIYYIERFFSRLDKDRWKVSVFFFYYFISGVEIKLNFVRRYLPTFQQMNDQWIPILILRHWATPILISRQNHRL